MGKKSICGSEVLMEIKNCPKCEVKTVRNGRSKSGKQRYYCRPCKRSFQVDYIYLACKATSSNQIALLTTESCGVRSIARIMRISRTTVIDRIKSIGKAAIRPFSILKGKEYEMDEMRTYVGNKKRMYWVVYAIRKDTKEIVDIRVGKRNMKTLQGVVDTLLYSEAKKINTDGFLMYESLIPEHLHNRRSYQINHIERKNLSIRTHLKRLSRRTICFSRSKEMLEACLRIYAWWSNLQCVSI